MLIAERNGMLVKGGYTARDYVQDGLVFQLDALENAGYGIRDTSKLEWLDLIGGVLFRKEYGIWSWGEYALIGEKTDDFKSVSPLPLSLSDSYTIEIVITSNPDNPTRKTINPSSGIRINSWGFGFFYTFGTACATGSDNILLWGCPWTIAELGAMRSLSMSVGEGNLRVYGDGGRDHKVYTSTQYGSFTNSHVNLSPAYGEPNYKIHAVRFYSRALTADEIAANYAVDKARFNLP